MIDFRDVYLDSLCFALKNNRQKGNTWGSIHPGLFRQSAEVEMLDVFELQQL